MRLTRIKLAGFKSFVDPTGIGLPSSRVGIVGPNGCGKSNIVDAVRWVLGESSRHLRGASAEDVIFNGSAARKPVGQASVELVFDNTEGALTGPYAAYSEIAVRRQVVRDGQTKYYLNGARCRLRDIEDLFLGTGLGPHSYAIIEQGMISRLIEARPEELRRFLEEAAGVSKYKERRRETELRIRHTQDNLARLDDLCEELGGQLERLARQAKNAKRYQTLKQEERHLRGHLLALRLYGFEQAARKAQQAHLEAEAHLKQGLTEHKAAVAALEDARARHGAQQAEVNGIQGQYYQVDGEVKRHEQDVEHKTEFIAAQGKALADLERTLSATTQALAHDSDTLNQVTAEIAALTPELAAAQAGLAVRHAALAQADEARLAWQARWEALMQRMSTPQQIVQVEGARIEQLEGRLAEGSARRSRLVARSEALAQEVQGIDLYALEQAIRAAQHEVTGAEERLKVTRCAIDEQRAQSRTLQAELDAARLEFESQHGRLTSLQTLQESALGQDNAPVRDWLARQGLADAPRLAGHVEVAEGWETALEGVLGHALQAVCVPDLDALAESLAELVQGELMLLEPPEAPDNVQRAAIERLMDKVRAPWPLEGLLDQVYIAPSLNAARERRQHLGPRESIVTQDGVWLGPHWIKLTRAADQQGLLHREHELHILRKTVTETRAAIETLQAKLEAGRAHLSALEQALISQQTSAKQAHRLAAEADSRQVHAQHRLAGIEAEQHRLAQEMTELDALIEQAKVSLEEARLRRDAARTQAQALSAERESLEQAREATDLTQREAREVVRQHNEAAQQVALRLEALRATQAAREQSLARAQAQRLELEARRTQVQQALTAREAPLETLRRILAERSAERTRLETTLGATRQVLIGLEREVQAHERGLPALEQCVDEARRALEQAQLAWQEAEIRAQGLSEQLAGQGLRLADFEDLNSPAEAVAGRLAEIVRRIERLGPINLAAIDEYQALEARKQYLDTQHADLQAALATLEQAIHKMDGETRSRLREIFAQVNAQVQTLFPRLFGGGQAQLEWIGDDPLEAGVAIMARPPGKRLSTIHLMSGGEKALTAVTVLFALFELNPAPFCLLDEVDAPLDEANVGRFCGLLREMAERVQFILITHNKLTMEFADHLIGVTMREPGVSRLVMVDVEEAVQMATG